MKSFEDIKISIKVELFCLKNFFLGKSFCSKKKLKKMLFEGKTFSVDEILFLKKHFFQIFFEKILFLKNI